MRRNRLYLVILVLALLSAATILLLRHFGISGGGGRRALSRLRAIGKPNVLLITVDTTRADHLPVYGYKNVRTPNIDSLARNGVLFRQCATAAPLTLPSHCSIMTGLYPTFHGVRVNGNTALSSDHLTLAEAFAAHGYQTGAFVGAFVLDGRWGLNQGFDHYDDQFDLKKYKKLDLGLVQRPGNKVVDAALNWLDGRKTKPFFAWVHLYDPHTPYAPPEPYRSQYASNGVRGLYDGEIAFMDEQIGRCLAWLDRNNLRKKTIVAVIGDHGEGLGEHGELTHGYFIYDYAVHVPFILSTPATETAGIQIASQVRSIDLYPTLLEASGIPVPKEVQGASLWPFIDSKGVPPRELFAYSESMAPSIQYGWSPLLSLRTPKFKFIDAPRQEFYDLESDPGEESDVRAAHAQTAAEFERSLKNLVAETAAGAPAATHANLDTETTERLAALGYIGTPVKTKAASLPTTQLVDPKDRLPVHEAIQKAGELNNNAQYSDSAQLLEQILKTDPENPQARLLLASNYVELKRSDEAADILRNMLGEDPENIRALVLLANILQDEGNPEEVVRLCQSAVKVDERNTQALAMMGQAYMDMHNFKLALPWLQKAVQIQPKLTQHQLNLAACQIGLKQYKEAEETLTLLVHDHPKFPLAHFHLGLLYEDEERIPDAIKEYEQEIALNPNGFMARFNLGRLKLRLNDHEGYMEQMREVVRIAPKNAAGYLFLARGLLQENADPNEILSLTQEGLSLAKTPDYKAMGYFMLADIYNRRNQPDLVKRALASANQYKAQIDN
jgi:arylsulfatase A-like enzyme/tetratricopeptide (TPR) repeat protein